MRHLLTITAVLATLSGCVIIIGDDDGSGGGGGVVDAGVLDGGGSVDAGCASPIPRPLAIGRNPWTGQCEQWDGGGDGCTWSDPEWAECGGYCETLDEATCLVADGCRAAYVDLCPYCDIYPPPTEFAGCWGVARTGPIQGGQCEGLDADACSRHDDCSPVHSRLEAPGGDGGFMNLVGPYEFCMTEKGAMPPPGCESLGEAACIGRADCEPQYQGVDCSCQPSGCTCADWQYLSCSKAD